MLLCTSCFEGIKDPFIFLPRAFDPYSDRRFMRVCSPSMMIGPSPSKGVLFYKGPEVAVRFRSSMEGDQKEVPNIMDRYLSFMGVGIRLRGDERVPRRDIISDFLEAALTLDYDLLPWARASIRIGNLVSLVVRRVISLPVIEETKVTFIERWAGMAKGMYERGDAFPQLRWVAISNQAILEHWCGDHDQALSLLEYVMKKKLSDQDRLEAIIKKASVLIDIDRVQEAGELIAEVPDDLVDSRLSLMKQVLGDGE
jgi:hypothetical protein